MASAAKPATATTTEFTFQIDGLSRIVCERGVGVSFVFDTAEKANAFPAKLAEFAFLIDAFCTRSTIKSHVYCLLLKQGQRMEGLHEFDIDEIIISVAKFHKKEANVPALTLAFALSPFYQIKQ